MDHAAARGWGRMATFSNEKVGRSMFSCEAARLVLPEKREEGGAQVAVCWNSCGGVRAQRRVLQRFRGAWLHRFIPVQKG